MKSLNCTWILAPKYKHWHFKDLEYPRCIETLLKYIFIFSVRGFVPAVAENRQPVVDLTAEQEKVRELAQRKQNLLLELNNYQGNNRVRKCLF